MTGTPTDRFGAALAGVFEELDWRLLGELACEGEGAAEFYDDDAREALLDAGLRFAADLGESLGALAESVGRSLYVGASVAELPMILYESVVVRRRVLWRNLPGRESAELGRALTAVGARLGQALPRIVCEGDWPPGPYDHLWLASVLTDPEHFPALHDELYQRRGTALATARGDLAADRRKARILLEHASSGLVAPGLLVTSDEELGLVSAALVPRGLELQPNECGRTSPIVGDVLRICAVRAAAH